MKIPAAAVLASALLGATGDPAASVRYFSGTWKCGETTVTFAPFTETGGWTRVSYGSVAPEGTAILGYVSGLHAFVYRDFHADGAYAELSSPGPSDGRWQWTGPYYPQEGGPPLQDRTTYVERSPTRFERTFELLQGAAYVPTGNDTCVKAAA
jgi:hypothetical protein